MHGGRADKWVGKGKEQRRDEDLFRTGLKRSPKKQKFMMESAFHDFTLYYSSKNVTI